MKNKVHKIKCLFIMVILYGTLFAVSGCKEEKPATTDTATELEIDVDISMTKIKDDVGAEAYWSERVSTDNNISIEADVVIPDATAMKIVQAQERYFSPEEKEEIIRLFTDETVHVYSMVISEDMTVSQLEEEIKWFEEYMESTSEYASSEELADMEDYLQELYGYLENASDDYKVAEDFEGQYYISKYGDYDYIFSFVGDSEFPSTSAFTMEIQDYKTRYDGKEYEKIAFDILNRYSYTDNMCEMTEEEACEQAMAIAGSIGEGDFEIIEVFPLTCRGWTEDVIITDGWEEEWNEGYIVTLYREIDGIAVDGRMWESVRQRMLNSSGVGDYTGDELEEHEHSLNYGYEKFVIAINDDGIVRLEYSSPYIIGEPLSDETELLSYNTIQDIILEELLANQELYKNAVFNKLELKYYPVRYEDNNESNYAIMPVWILTQEDIFDTKRYVIVNAIDGEIIDIAGNEKVFTYDKQ